MNKDLNKMLIFAVVITLFLVGISIWHIKSKTEMYPGLGIRELHTRGIDGTGIGVAIIDQKLLLDHCEYANSLVYYKEMNSLNGEPNSMHGPAVSSILVGKNCGVAPGAKLYYWVVPVQGEEPGGVRFARAIKDVILFNSTLTEEERIRILSISAGFRQEEGGNEFAQAIKEAWDSGIAVFTSTFPYFTDPVISVYNAALKKGGSRDEVNDYVVQPDLVKYIGQSAETIVQIRHQQGNGKISYEPVWVPVEPRLLASPRGTKKYELFSTGGDSWATPYVAGVAALILQANPRLSNKQVVEIIATSTLENIGGLLMIAPIQAVSKAQGVKDR